MEQKAADDELSITGDNESLQSDETIKVYFI